MTTARTRSSSSRTALQRIPRFAGLLCGSTCGLIDFVEPSGSGLQYVGKCAVEELEIYALFRNGLVNPVEQPGKASKLIRGVPVIQALHCFRRQWHFGACFVDPCPYAREILIETENFKRSALRVRDHVATGLISRPQNRCSPGALRTQPSQPQKMSATRRTLFPDFPQSVAPSLE